VNIIHKAVVVCNTSLPWINEVAMAAAVLTKTESTIARYPEMVRVGLSD